MAESQETIHPTRLHTKNESLPYDVGAYQPKGRLQQQPILNQEEPAQKYQRFKRPYLCHASVNLLSHSLNK